MLGWRPMHVLSHPPSPRRKRCLLAAFAASSAALLLSSCASPGVPLPPSLHLPRVVTDLTAQRVGNDVHLHWTSPSRTTDGLNVPVPMTAEVCRETNPSLAKPSSPKGAGRKSHIAAPQTVPGCDVVLHLTVKSGPSDAEDHLPASLTADPVRPIGYRVSLLNSQGRSAGLSPAAVVAAGEAPAPVMGLRATASRDGAILEWKPVDANVVVELDRTLQAPPAAHSPAKTKTPGKSSALDLTDEQPTEVRLRASKDEASTKDPGGTVDRTALRGQQYVYRAQRIRVVQLGENRMEMRSAVSAAAALTMSDRFAPAAPTGLASIPGTQDGKATIDLSWQANHENDVAGYNVYRRAGSAGPFQLITGKPDPGPAFSDTTVTTSETYTYRVTAIDNDGNESKPSDEVTETARPQQ